MNPHTLFLRCSGQSDYTLLASGFGDGDMGGGLFAFDGSGITPIDSVSSTGLFIAGGRLFPSIPQLRVKNLGAKSWSTTTPGENDS